MSFCSEDDLYTELSETMAFTRSSLSLIGVDHHRFQVKEAQRDWGIPKQMRLCTCDDRNEELAPV